MKTTYRYEWVKCGKRCSGCPHGPYVYAYWREGGKLRKRYIGKPQAQPGSNGDTHGQGAPPDEEIVPDPRGAIFSDRTASLELAICILELSQLPKSVDVLKNHYRQRSLELHPDRGGSDHEMRLLNCAYAYCLAAIRP
jgi:hypothetical protein